MMTLSPQLVADVLEAFYTDVRRDVELGPVFYDIVGDRWPLHMRRINHFWCTALRMEHGYRAAAFMPAHLKHPNIKSGQIDRWMSLFERVVVDHVPDTHRNQFMRVSHAMSENLRISLERRDRRAPQF